MRSVSLVANQMVHILHTLHISGYLHRDLKPENILLGSDHRLCLIDYGLSKKCQQDMPPKTQRIFGSVRYASKNAHFGDSSRQGDL